MVDGADLPAGRQVASRSIVRLNVGETFDAVVLVHVLEHVHELRTFLFHLERVLVPGGRLVAAIVHPMNTDAGADSYFAEQHLPYEHERDGVRIVLNDMHRPLSAYFEALEAGGEKRVNCRRDRQLGEIRASDPAAPYVEPIALRREDLLAGRDATLDAALAWIDRNRKASGFGAR